MMISDRYWEYYWVKHLGLSVSDDILSDVSDRYWEYYWVKHLGLSVSDDILSDDFRQILGILLSKRLWPVRES